MRGIATNGLARGDPLVDPLRRPSHRARAQADGGWEVVGPDEAVDRRPGESGAFHHRAHAQHSPVDGLMTVPSIRPIHAFAPIVRDWIGVIVCHGRYLPVRFLDKASVGHPVTLVPRLEIRATHGVPTRIPMLATAANVSFHFHFVTAFPTKIGVTGRHDGGGKPNVKN